MKKAGLTGRRSQASAPRVFDSACLACIGLGVTAGVDGGHEGFIRIRLVPPLDGGHPAVPDPEYADRRLSRERERIRCSNINGVYLCRSRHKPQLSSLPTTFVNERTPASHRMVSRLDCFALPSRALVRAADHVRFSDFTSRKDGQARSTRLIHPVPQRSIRSLGRITAIHEALLPGDALALFRVEAAVRHSCGSRGPSTSALQHSIGTVNPRADAAMSAAIRVGSEGAVS